MLDSQESVAEFFRAHFPCAAVHIAKISTLTGGYVNFVYRIVFDQEVALPETSTNADTYTSVILKFAPPYLASIGPTATFSQDRLKFEAQALSLVPSAFPEIFQDKRVGLPHLIVHLLDEHVLLMQDLGPIESLLSAPQHLTEECATVTARFISSLHALSRARLGSSLSQYRNDASTQAVIDIVYKPTGEILRDGGVENWEALDNEAQQTVRRLYDLDESPVLLMGDLWSGSLLVEEKPPGFFEKLWVIDWEYSNLGHPILDISYFITIIWIQAQRTDARRKEILKFIATFMREYTFLNLPDHLKLDRLFTIHFGVSLLNEAAFGRWCSCELKETGKVCQKCTRDLYEEGVKVLQKPGYLYDLLLPLNV